MQKISNKILRLIGILFVFLLIQFNVNASERVSSVKAYQSGKNIVIEYDLVQDVENIGAYISINRGSWKSIKSVTGDVGRNIKKGKKKIIWDVLNEYNDGFTYSNVRFLVYATGVPSKNFFMLNGGFTTLPDYSYGLTYAWVKRAGFYFSAMSNFKFRFNSDYVGDSSGYVNGTYPLYSGKKEYTKITATTGLMIRFCEPLYMYLGGGYGYRGMYYETVGNEWVAIQGNHCIYHGGVGEIGLIGNIYGFSLSLGLSVITDLHNYYPEAKVGIGYCF